MQGLIQISYFSSVSSQWTPFDTGAILQVSRRNNLLRGITGLLLFDKGQYLQVLEGDPKTVNSLFEVIKDDRRHTGVTEVFRQPIVHRDFAGWSMAYQELSKVGPEVQGYTEFLRDHFDIGSIDASATKSLLQLFKRRA